MKQEFNIEQAAEAEVAAAANRGNNELSRAVQLGEAMMCAEARVAECEAALAAAKAAFVTLSTGDLPELMTEIGLTMFKMPNGAVFTLKEDVHCGISEERREAAHTWLVENNYSGLIKTVVSAEFGVDEQERATEIEGLMREAGAAATHKESIHHARLKSFIKERLEAGEPIPFDLFGIHPYRKVTYEQPKAKRAIRR